MGVVYAKRRHETIGPWNSGSTDLFLECFQRLSGNGKERMSKTTHCLISSVVIVILATFQGLLYFFESALNLGNGMLNFWVAEGVILLVRLVRVIRHRIRCYLGTLAWRKAWW